MNALTLDETQQQKLLEMIAYCFPEFPEVEITKSFPYYNCNEIQGLSLTHPKLSMLWIEKAPRDAVSLWVEDKDESDALTIPWYEFVNTHLIKKLSEKVGYRGYRKDNSLFFQYVQYCCLPFGSISSRFEPVKITHPVDWLYENVFQKRDTDKNVY